MVRNFVLLFTLVGIGAAVAMASPVLEEAFAPGEIDFSRANPALSYLSANAGQTAISLTSPEVVMLDSVVDYETYQAFGIPGEPYRMEEGHPAIPQVTRIYRIPNTGSVELVIGATTFHVVEDVNPLPIQLEKAGFTQEPAREAAIYSRNEWYPPVVAEISEPMILRDFRVVSVTLYPVQVNPQTGQARIYDQLDVDIVANDSPGENELLNVRAPSGAFVPVYRNVIQNLDEGALDDAMQTPGAIIVLCKNNATVLQWADSFATWKKRRGYEVVIDARSSWTASDMRTAIRTAYQTWDPPLEYACIIGDARSGSFSMPTHGTYYDHYFALMTDGDDLEDIGVGRLSCQNESHLMTINAKIMGYERTPYMDNPGWFHRAFLYASTNYFCRSNVQTMLWARRQFQHFTSCDTVNVDTHSGNVSESLIASRLNQGVSFFLWRGANVDEMFLSAATCMNASWKLPVVLTVTCGTGWINQAEQQVSEAWLLAGTANAPEGGICGIGSATWSTHVQYNNTVAGGFAYAICNLGIEHLGVALAAAKAQLHAAYPGSSWAVSVSSWNNLIGDPSLSMWTEEPVVMDVTFPGTVNVGTRRVRPQVTNQANSEPIEGALVVLWKGNETYAKGVTDAGGFVDIPVTVNMPGTMWLTVTKRNHKPFLADVTCVSADRMVALSSYTVDDDNVGGTSGNLDGNINPGEVIDLPLYLRNFGVSLAASNVTASLSGDNSRVTIVNGTQTFADIAPGDSALSFTPFRISISPLMLQDERAIMTLEVTASGEVTYSSFELRCRAGDGVFVSSVVSGGDGDARLEPDETADLRVTFRNEGDINMPTVTGTLISTSSFIAVTQNQGSFGTVGIDEQGTNTNSAFQLRANTLVYPGHQAGFMLVLSTSGGSVDTVTFSLPIGFVSSTDPTGPDGFGYYAYDDTDDSVEFHREFSYVDITGLGQNLNLNDPGEQAPTSNYSVVRALPFPFTFYGAAYDTITICSNGWAAFGAQGDLDLFRNYPIPAEQAPDAMLAVFWDDLKTSGSGNGVWIYNDAANHRYIIQWKATGWAGPDANIHQDFECVLLDPVYHPTRDGSGIVVYQYQDVTEMVGDYPQGVPDVVYSTIGICAPGSLMGLQYRFNNLPSPGGASMVDGRCITFTTESRAAFGHITGHIEDAETQQPMFGVLVFLVGHNDQAVTDVNGDYTIADVLIGTYTVRAQQFGFNEAVVENVVIEMDSTEIVNFGLTHPEIALSTDNISVHLPADPPETSFRITNDGNGPLDYNISIQYAPSDPLDDAWDYLNGVDISQATGDYQIQGCEFAGDYWWVSGAGGPQGDRLLYRFDLEGDYVNAVPQPATSSSGWFDMAYDGELIYGSDGPFIFGIDQTGGVHDTISCSPLNPTRAIAYDPQSGHFWVADYTSDIYELSHDEIVRRVTNEPRIPITGLAWNVSDPDGYKLYIFHRTADSLRHAQVTRMHPVSGDRQFVAQLETAPGDGAGGCTITSAWNSTLLVFGGILQNSTADRLGIWELTFNTTWITVTPMIASVPPNSWRDVTVAFDATDLRDYTYRVNLTLRNNSVDSALVLPVELVVALAADDVPTELPQEYALYQNYPNPFNGTTTLKFDLKQPGMTTLKVYNLLGQEVATVVEQLMDAGRHAVNFDMNDLASGVYVYRIESGSFVDARKLVLLK